MTNFMDTNRMRRWMLLAIVAAALVLSACKTGKGKGDGDDIERQPPIRAKSSDAQERFDRAMEMLRDGQYDRAREAFRLLQAEFGSDPIADLSELYVARASMGPIRLGESLAQEATQAYKGSAEAAQILATLAQSDDVDKRIRYGAKAYHALEMALRGKTNEALSVLADYPSASISDVVLDADRTPVRALLTESFYRAGRNAETLEAAARLHAEVTARHQELVPATDEPLEQPTAGGQSDPTSASQAANSTSPEVAYLRSLEALARQRGFEAAEKNIEEVALQDYLTSDSAFVRAAAGWGLLGEQLADGVGEEQRAALEDLFNRVAPDLVQIGAGLRAAELSMRLAAVGGPKRLAIGFLAPLTGPHKAIGQRAMAGALVAMRAFHHAGYPEVTLVFQDSRADATEAFERLERQKVLAVVGPLDVRRAKQFAPLAQAAKIPLITLTTEAVGQSTPSDAQATDAEGEAEQSAAPYVFRNFIDAAAEARAAARVAFDEIGDRKAAVVYPDVGYGQVTAKAFADEFRDLGGQIVAEISYDRSKSDFANVARRLARANPEAVFLPDSAEKVAELTAFFANENIWGLAPTQKRSKRSKRKQVHYLGTSLWEDPMLIRQAASYVEGAAIPVWFSASLETAPVREFVNRFEAIYGRKPENFEAFAYDSVNWLRSLVLERGMRRPVAIRDALVSGDRHPGVTGTVQMTASGEPRRALRFVTPTDEGFEALEFTAVTGPREVEEASEADEAGDEAAEQDASSQSAPPNESARQ
ncbi:hypothetical protein FIV42_27205 [Persicimonas caeni]|uniref:Leucine-binding protein domain-containing protein n=2 Tax=Persicimonas caeni TaxID=2292766 RepID=A0A4Y6Q1D4_PERCE|nr:hypothetical protein FIV42_27205 [Persicimonas caeni]QED35521.1 ABC transporter substrate-binding protein [Persicimonas caeni]